jgi:hypothetical protein
MVELERVGDKSGVDRSRAARGRQTAREHNPPRAHSILPYALLSAVLALAGETLYGVSESLGLALFILGVVPFAVTLLIVGFFRPWVSVKPAGITWRYLGGKETVAWEGVRRLGKVAHPAGGYRLYVEIDASAMRCCGMGRMRRRLTGPAGASLSNPGGLRAWVPVGKLLRGLKVGSLKNLPAGLRKVNPNMQVPERGLAGPWGRYRIVSLLLLAVMLLAIVAIGLTR